MGKTGERADGLIMGTDGRPRCWWHGGEPEYQRYHDEEWGRPMRDDRRLFEKICLEGFQAGLSWWTILQRRPNFRAAFCDFDFHQVARFDEARVEALLQDRGIIRHRGKIEATINNAARALELVEEFGSLADYFWGWQPPADERPTRMTKAALIAIGTPPAAKALSKDLRTRGWKFGGPTTCYAFMQAMGLVNDLLEGCFCRDEVAR